MSLTSLGLFATLGGFLIGGRGWLTSLRAINKKRGHANTRSDGNDCVPSVVCAQQPAVGRCRHTSTQPGGSTAPYPSPRPHPAVPCQLLPRLLQTSCTRNLLHSAPLASVTVRLLPDNLRSLFFFLIYFCINKRKKNKENAVT